MIHHASTERGAARRAPRHRVHWILSMASMREWSGPYLGALEVRDLDWAWLVREAKVDDPQNRLGFLVTVARQLAELRGETGTAKRLAEQGANIERSRLQREGAFGESRTDAERRWLRKH